MTIENKGNRINQFFLTIFCAMVYGFIVYWWIQNVYLDERLTINTINLSFYYLSGGYFLATIVLGIIVLLNSLFNDWSKLSPKPSNLKIGFLQKILYLFISSPVIYSLRIVFVAYLFLFWLSLLKLIWFLKFNYIFEIVFPFSLWPFLLILNFLSIITCVVFEPWFYMLLQIKGLLFCRNKSNNVFFPILTSLLIRIGKYSLIMILIFWFSQPSNMTNYKNPLISTLIFISTMILSLIIFRKFNKTMMK